MKIAATTILLSSLLLASIVPQIHSICDDSDEVLADVCYKLYDQIRHTLLGDEGNFYRLRKAFFYSPNANPVLLKVIYNISFADNVTELAQRQPNYCTSTNETENNDTISLNQTQLIFGWTSSGVFTVFHPMTINFMQIQLPFALMRIIYSIFERLDPTESGPEAKTFLWDGSYNLPALHINLHFNSLPCIPSVELFNSVLMDFNSLVRIYAGQAITGVIQDSENAHFVGFSLPSYTVSPQDIRTGSDFWLYFGYMLSSIVLYVTCFTTLNFLASKSDKKEVRQYFTEKHPEVLKGVTIIITGFILAELLTELIMAIIWTVHVHDSGVSSIIFFSAFVYIAPAVASIFKVLYDRYKHKLKNVVYNILCRHKIKPNKKHNDSNIVFDFFVCVVAYFAYILLYSFFPAFILAFAYPTRIITIFTFVYAFMVLSVVYITTYIKHVQDTIKRTKQIQDMKKRTKKLKVLKVRVPCYSFFLTIVLIYFFLFIFALLYSLVIGRASVVSSAPLAILSLLPTILISVAAWLMKSTMLKKTKSDNKEEVQHEEERQHAEGVQLECFQRKEEVWLEEEVQHTDEEQEDGKKDSSEVITNEYVEDDQEAQQPEGRHTEQAKRPGGRQTEGDQQAEQPEGGHGEGDQQAKWLGGGHTEGSQPEQKGEVVVDLEPTKENPNIN